MKIKTWFIQRLGIFAMLLSTSSFLLADSQVTTNTVPPPVCNACQGSKQCSACKGSGTAQCNPCQGKGKQRSNCSLCSGRGRRSQTVRRNGKTRSQTRTCSTCSGRGYNERNCTSCGGDGKVDCAKCKGTKKCSSCSKP